MKEFMTQAMLVEQTPLDTLVISQITEIRKRENNLQMRFYQLSPGAEQGDQISLAEEVRLLEQYADRLNRMMDAMRGYTSQIVRQDRLGERV